VQGQGSVDSRVLLVLWLYAVTFFRYHRLASRFSHVYIDRQIQLHILHTAHLAHCWDGGIKIPLC
jgi:hypothetical protein